MKKSLVGQVFGKLTALERIYDKKQECSYYKCVCECGNEHIARRQSLVRGDTTKCDNCSRKITIGKRKGRLVVVEKLETKDKDGRNFWRYKCDCGDESTVSSIGFVKKTQCSKCGKAQGLRKLKDHAKFKGYEEITGTYIYRTNRNAKARQLEFDITIQELWELYLKQNKKCALSGMEIIFTNGIGPSVSSQTASLDRIDSSKGYTKDNIQWVHKDINRMKNDYDNNYFIEICKKVCKNHRNKKK